MSNAINNSTKMKNQLKKEHIINAENALISYPSFFLLNVACIL